MKKISFCFLVITFGSFISSALAWHDQTHIAIGEVVGFDQAYNLAAPDVAKLKAHTVEDYNHWVNNPKTNKICDDPNTICPKLIRGQIQKYNLGTESEKKGHLYGAIIAAIRAYQDETAAGNFATYHLVYAGHYIGDLSMPFHNIENSKFARLHHKKNDELVEKEIRANLNKIEIFPITIKNENDLVEQIARIATKSKELGYRLQKEKSEKMTVDEAYQQISQSASLFKAVLEYVGYPIKIGNNP
jgi:hypothetical protein